MHFPTPIEIDFYNFFKTGKFDYLKIGQTKEWILNNFPDPDDYDDSFLDASIWCYGNIELHFYEEKLSLIFSDYLSTLHGGDSLTLKKWILEKPENLTLHFVMTELLKENMDFSITHYNNMLRLAITQSGVELTFSKEDPETDTKYQDPNEYPLYSFALYAQQ